MNLTSLKYALEVERCGSVTNAARRLSVSQPNLSKIIKELEQDTGFALFVRKNKGMLPTKQGKEFLQEAAKVVDGFEGLQNYCQKSDTNWAKMSVAVPRASYITHGFMHFMKQIDDGRRTEIYFNETNSTDAIHDIVDQRCTSGIIRYDIRYEKYFLSMLQLEGLVYEPLLEFEYVFITSGESELASKEKVYFRDLENEIEILHGDTVIPSLAHHDLIRQADALTNRRVYVYERGSQFDLLADEKNTFMWVSPIPQKVLERYHLVQKNCEDHHRVMKDLYVYPKGYQLSEYEQMFLKEVKKVVKHLHHNMKN